MVLAADRRTDDRRSTASAQMADRGGQTLLDSTHAQTHCGKLLTSRATEGDAFELFGIRGLPKRNRSPVVVRRWSVVPVSVAARQSFLRSGRRAIAPASSSRCWGAAGVGKSRLVHEFLVRPPSRGRSIARGRCLPYGEGITYWPLLEVIKEAIGLEDDDSPDEPRQGQARRGTCRRADPRKPSHSRSRRPSGWPRRHPARKRSPGRSGRCSRSWRAQRRPVFVFDDIHWGEPTLLDLLEHLAEWTRDAPILLDLPRAAGAPRRPARMGRRQVERDNDPARAARRSGVR